MILKSGRYIFLVTSPDDFKRNLYVQGGSISVKDECGYTCTLQLRVD
ncbi:hypothetical protein [Mucilaginibacter defluvii]